MGFFGAIGGALGAIGGAISSAVGSIGGAIGRGLGAIAGKLSSGIGGKILSALGRFGSFLGPVVNIISLISSAFNLFGNNQEEVDMEDLGYRMALGDEKGIHRENYNNFKDYYEELMEKTESIDKEKFTQEELNAFKIISGTQLALDLRDEGIIIPVDIYKYISTIGTELDKDKIKELSNYLKANSIDEVLIEKYIKNDLTYDEKKDFIDKFKEITSILGVKEFSEIKLIESLKIGD